MKTKYSSLIGLLLTAVILLIYSTKLYNDFWNDELYTLVHFTLVPISQTVSDYHVPNNHVFFNLINNLYLKLIGITELNALLERPQVLRIIPFSYCLALLLVAYYNTKLLFSNTVAILSLLLIAGSIPYFNFALQIRGYGLSCLLLLLALFNSLKYYHFHSKKYLIRFVAWSTLCCYAILSNVYSIFTICFFWIVLALFQYLKKRDERSLKFFKALTLASVSIGLLVFILYLPLLDDILSNDYATKFTPFLQWQIEFYLPLLKEAFISSRWIIFILFIVSPFINYRYFKKKKIAVFLLLLLCITPVFISYARGDEAPLRTFLPLFPLSSIIVGFGLYGLFNLAKNPKVKTSLIVVTAIYLGFIFFQERKNITKTIKSDIENGGKRQFLYHQYYNAYYQPLKACEEFKEKINPQEPLLIMGCDVHGIPLYLKKFNLPFYDQETSAILFDSLRKNKENFYLVTNRPNQIEVLSGDSIEQISSVKTYHTFMKYFTD